jgi:hypothetical protein
MKCVLKCAIYILIVLTIGCAKETTRTPASPSTGPNIQAFADAVETSRQTRLAVQRATPREVVVDLDAYAACVGNATRQGKDTAECNCVKQAIEQKENPQDVCATRGLVKQPKDGEEDKDDDEAPSSTPHPFALTPPMFVGFVGPNPPPGWSPATGFKFDGRSFPWYSDDRGEYPMCDIELMIDGKRVLWMRGGASGRQPVLVPVPEGAGIPVATGRGNMASILPRGESGYVLLSSVVSGGRLVQVPVAYGRHPAGIRCWRADVGITNPAGRPMPAVSMTLIKEGVPGLEVIQNPSGREEFRLWHFQSPSSSLIPW